jgi:carboxylesterase type B
MILFKNAFLKIFFIGIILYGLLEKNIVNVCAKIDKTNTNHHHIPSNNINDLKITSTGVIQTTYGPIEGYTLDDVDIYYNIPFAQPPIKELRFSSPTPPIPWTSTRLSLLPPSLCPQLRVGSFYLGNEDCLYLNIFVPSKRNATLSTMFWIYGGDYVFGDSYEFGLYQGANLAKSQNMIVVTSNYRLSGLGFLALPELQSTDPLNSTGNYALLDQELALDFIRANINAFGGSANDITIVGESAGAFSVCWHLASPFSQNKFAGAIMESGTCDSEDFFIDYNDAVSTALNLSASIGCKQRGDELIACLRESDASNFVISLSDAVDSSAIAVPSNALFVTKNIQIDTRMQIPLQDVNLDDPFTIEFNNLQSLPATLETVRDLYLGKYTILLPFINSLDLKKSKIHRSLSKYSTAFAPVVDWGPVIDGVALKDLPLNTIAAGEWSHVPVIAGTNLNEGTIFVSSLYDIIPNRLHKPLIESDIPVIIEHVFPNNASMVNLTMDYYPASSYNTTDDLVSELLRDYIFSCPSRRALLTVASQDIPAYLYQFDYPGDFIEDPYLGVYHSAELVYVFDNEWPPLIHPFSKNDTEIASIFGYYWGNFVKYGNPNGGGDGNTFVSEKKESNNLLSTIEWPKISIDNDVNLRIDLPLYIDTNLLSKVCNFWDDVKRWNPDDISTTHGKKQRDPRIKVF